MRKRAPGALLGRIVVLALCAALLAPATLAGQDAPKIPPGVYLPVPMIRQTTPVWCWLAASEMVIRYKTWGKSIRQCEIYEIVHKLPTDACCANPEKCMRTGGLREIQAIIGHFGGRQSRLAPATDPMQLHRLLSAGHVVVAALMMTPHTGHVVVIRGMDFQPRIVKTPKGLETKMVPVLLVNDPLSFITQRVEYAKLLPHWAASIIVF